MTSAANLDRITDFPALVRYLRDELEWEIPGDAHFDDVTFSWSPAEIGLDLAEPIQVTQLRPLRAGQPWGVFFLNFPNRQLPVTVMRRILRGLSKRKRASSNPADRAAWDKEDLLFISAVGDADDRRLSFAHFQDRGADLPTLRVIGWDRDDTVRRLSHVDELLREQLSWPAPGVLPEKWRDRWRSAFTERPREAVRTAREMAEALAALARDIRDRIKLILPNERADGDLRQLFEAVRQTLTHDLDVDKFADTYAQTIAYGLLSARINQTRKRDEAHAERQKVTLGPKPELPPITADAAGQAMPTTNPFLKELFGSFLRAGGRDADGAGLDFDELGVGELVDLLNAADMEAVLLDFDKQKAGDDPVIHFYEGFLHAYDKDLKVQRGVFYTPRPVVSFIVRAIDEVLRSDFGLKDGLADTTTWEEFVAKHPEMKIPDGLKGDAPFVQILDPATGTGTFLVEAIDLIHSRMVEKWTAGGQSEQQRLDSWNDYVPAHLLPRLYGFEIMMAPYAVAHMKIGLKLADTGYRFAGRTREGQPARARVFLTNSLEPAQDFDMQLTFMSEAMAHEAMAANEAKLRTSFTIVMGNPPYSGVSSNNSTEAKQLVEAYKYVSGVPINEKKLWLQDDYVKFIAKAQEHITLSGTGMMGMITNHGYLENPTFRGMRWNLTQTFSRFTVIDLHGNTNKKERAPDGTIDENVFDIRQGVAISIASTMGQTPRFRKGDAWGLRDDKYKLLSGFVQGLELAELVPAPELFLFTKAEARVAAYDLWPSLSDVFPIKSVGFVTARDSLTIDISSKILWDRVMDFAKCSEAVARRKYDLGKDARDWKVSSARADVRDSGPKRKFLSEFLYRPFDFRWTYYTGRARGFYASPCRNTMEHMDKGNVSLSFCRREELPVTYSHFLATDKMTEHGLLSSKTTNYQAPLWLTLAAGEMGGRPNLAESFTTTLAMRIGLVFEGGVEKQRQQASSRGSRSAALKRSTARRERGDLKKTLGARDVFDWIYAVLYSPTYRERYADFLKSDFARVPLPGDRALFIDLTPLGTELVALHLLDAEKSRILAEPRVRFVANGVARLGAWGDSKDVRRTASGRVYINGGCWFETVPQRAWNHWIGGYQPAQKWLKDRAARGGSNAREGRILTAADQLHYRRMIIALERTAEIMIEIDQVITRHGGWPDAFKGMTD